MLTIDNIFFARGTILKSTRVKTNSIKSTTPMSIKVKTNFARGTTLGNIGVKRKRSSIFTLVIEAINKNIKVLMDSMDRINSIQLDIDKNITKMQEKT